MPGNRKDKVEGRKRKAENKHNLLFVETSLRGCVCLVRLAPFVLLASLIFLPGCSKNDLPKDAIARVGEWALTKDIAGELAGMAYDSLSTSERFRLIESWVERKLMELEGERRGYAKDADIAVKLEALRAELYASKLLAAQPASMPSDSVIQKYYSDHRSEFLRPTDSYLIELYWGETRDVVDRFRADLQRGDTTAISEGTIASEGRWLAEHTELDPSLADELSKLGAGQIAETRPYEDGFRVMKLVEKFPAGAVLDLAVVRDEIVGRILLEESKARQERMLAELKKHWRVEIFEK